MADYYQMNNLLLASMNKLICETNASNYAETIEIINKHCDKGKQTVELCKKLSKKITTNSKEFLESNQTQNLPVFWKTFLNQTQTKQSV